MDPYDYFIKVELEDGNINKEDTVLDKKTLSTEDREFSNDMNDACKTYCQICQEPFPLSKMRLHTSKEHQLQITQYKQLYGNFNQDESLIIKMVYHKCHICDETVLLDSDRLENHIKGVHKMKEKDYKALYMISTPRKVQPTHQKKDKEKSGKRPMQNTSTFEDDDYVERSKRTRKRPYWRELDAKNYEMAAGQIEELSGIRHKGVKSRGRYRKTTPAGSSKNKGTRKPDGNKVKMSGHKSQEKETKNTPQMKPDAKMDCVIVKEERASQNPRDWTVDQTFAAIIRTDPSIAPEDIRAIRDQKINGKALLKISVDELVTLGKMKLGPAVQLKCLADVWNAESQEFQ